MVDISRNKSDIQFIVANKKDIATLEKIRELAFQPIFDSFRNILGDTIYKHAQLPEDEAQKVMLISLFDKDSVWKTWKVNLEEVTVGFVSVRLDKKAKVGEIGLNAVYPKYAKRGIGTQMYDFAVEIMKKEGMKVATVATGGDPSHVSARKAYRKAGFDVEIPSVWMCQLIEQ